jgi:hypothetical protein
MFCYARRDGEPVARSKLCGGFPVFAVLSVNSSPNRRRKERCKSVDMRASVQRLAQARKSYLLGFFVRKGKLAVQCSSTPEKKDNVSFAQSQ